MRRLLAAVVISGCLLSAVPAVSLAEGFTLWSGVDRKNQLSYRTDFGAQANNWDRYYLRVDGKRLQTAVAEFIISTPDYFNGKFDPRSMEVKVRGRKVPLANTEWDKESRVVRITLQEPIPAGTSAEIILSNVKNPATGMYNLNCLTQAPGDIPLPRYIGTWIMSIN